MSVFCDKCGATFEDSICPSCGAAVTMLCHPASHTTAITQPHPPQKELKSGENDCHWNIGGNCSVCGPQCTYTQDGVHLCSKYVVAPPQKGGELLKQLSQLDVPDGKPWREILCYLRMCAAGWQPEARILGDLRACDIMRACDEALKPCRCAELEARVQDEEQVALHAMDDCATLRKKCAELEQALKGIVERVQQANQDEEDTGPTGGTECDHLAEAAQEVGNLARAALQPKAQEGKADE